LPGTRGEITVSGGFNPYLPLLRYRTGDYASLAFHGTRPVLLALEGRAPVVFRATDGRAINNIDVSTVLKPLALAQYALHQSADGALLLRVRDAGVDTDEAAIRATLLGLFGASLMLRIEKIDSFAESGDKLLQYTREETGGK
jgi:phenylacetate-CoA ligase